MAAYWKYPLDEQSLGIDWWYHCDTTEYERAALYGLLTIHAFGSEYLQDGEIYFHSPLRIKDKWSTKSAFSLVN